MHAMKAGLQLRLGQHLALTPQLQQSIRLLQLSTLELNQEIEQALVENPLLERLDDPLATALRVAADGAIVGSSSQVTTTSTSATADAGGDDVAAEPAGADEPLADWGASSSRGERDDDDSSPLDWASATPTLTEHLLEQLATTRASARDRVLVEMLIDALDENGYLTCTLDEVCALCPSEAQVEFEEVTAALALLQSFDPPGVGARSPAECLRLQIDALPVTRTGLPAAAIEALRLARCIVSDHLALLAARDFVRLRRVLEVSDEQLRAAQQVILGLNPHPGVGFSQSRTDYVVPDIHVRRKSGRWVAQLNPDVMPRLRVNPDYAAAVKAERRTDRNKEDASWSTRLQEARWLIRNMQQRFDTILRVSQAIVERQSNFFTHGEIAMRPLVLREIADTVGLHESTISRVTTGKYMATAFGVFELKYFFGSHVATETGGAASSTAIRALIRQLIGAEDPKNPLSDSRLAELLGEQGIMVARRTVAKYREALKIGPVALRKSL